MKKNYMPKFVGFPIANESLGDVGYFITCMAVTCAGCGERHPWNLTLSKN